MQSRLFCFASRFVVAIAAKTSDLLRVAPGNIGRRASASSTCRCQACQIHRRTVLRSRQTTNPAGRFARTGIEAAARTSRGCLE